MHSNCTRGLRLLLIFYSICIILIKLFSVEGIEKERDIWEKTRDCLKKIWYSLFSILFEVMTSGSFPKFKHFVHDLSATELLV
ncbi:hypothetical protein GcM3_03228 [Golovinomyces cichoracearum]|uniref:Uncharacterized protein n=1 Tax=Golovinomyces cichoracearum TaxID=62708 RepID=A0A420IPV9_9PEZI|nr:hypothetical protein GcM3_03228 [Golovinomyces cichoracearum]